MIDDLKIKQKYYKSVLVYLARKGKQSQNQWEISYFFQRLAEIQYKAEILASVEILLTRKVPPENIFIIGSSFKLNRAYGFVDEFRLEKSDINSLNRLGQIVPFGFNSHLNLLRIVFDLTNNVTKLLKKNQIRNIGKPAILIAAYKKIHENKFDLALSTVAESFEGKRKYATTLKKKSVQKQYRKCVSDAKKQLAALTTLQKLKLEKLKPHETKGVLEKLTVEVGPIKFFKKLTYASRPIVGYYSPKEKRIRIIARDHINKSIKPVSPFILRYYSKNSPAETIAQIAGRFLEVLAETPQRKLKEDLLREQIVTEKKKQQKLDYETTSARMDAGTKIIQFQEFINEHKGQNNTGLIAYMQQEIEKEKKNLTKKTGETLRINSVKHDYHA